MQLLLVLGEHQNRFLLRPVGFGVALREELLEAPPVLRRVPRRVEGGDQIGRNGWRPLNFFVFDQLEDRVVRLLGWLVPGFCPKISISSDS